MTPMRIALFSILASLTISASCHAEDTPHYAVLTEFVRELVETKNNEDIAKKEFASVPKGNLQEANMAIIRNGTRVKLMLSATIARLQQMHLSHLVITRKQGQEILNSLQRGFGTSMNAKEQNWTVSSASVLRTYLRDKGYKFSDDPWQ